MPSRREFIKSTTLAAGTGSWGKSKNGAFREIARIDVAEIGKSGYRGKTHIHINKAANHLPPYTRLPGE
jgi:hypothetical protein